MVVDFDVRPELDDFASGGDEVGLAAGKLHGAHAVDGNVVLVYDFVVWIGEELEAEGIFGAPGFVSFDGIEGDTEDYGVGGVVLGLIALEVMSFDGAALGLILGVEVEDDPFAFVVGEGDWLVLLGGQGEVGCGCADGDGVSGMSFGGEATERDHAQDESKRESFTHRYSPLVKLCNYTRGRGVVGWRDVDGRKHSCVRSKQVGGGASGGDDGDVGEVGCVEDGRGIEEEGLSGFDGEAGGAGGLHGADGGEADDGDVEAHVLIGLGDFDDGEAALQGGGVGGVVQLVQRVEGAEEGAGAFDGGVGTFHGFDGDTGLCGDDDGLTEVEGGDAVGDGSSVGDVLLFLFVGVALGEDSGLGEKGFEVLGGGDELDAFVGEDFGDGSEEHVGVAGAEVEEEFGETPVGADGGEDLFVLDLSGHGGAGDAFAVEDFDEAGEFAEGEPVEVDGGVGGGACVDVGVGLLLDGGDDDGEVVGAGGVEEEEGEAAVAGDEAEFIHAFLL